ncbi:MAG TPA: 3-phosphoshikimate 1-carboxyvinyltransferase [Terriglobales bacterium]|nr:3-phosphoshikimate 1-carboxyvinyltransferase [Terriglobales bacterium]
MSDQNSVIVAPAKNVQGTVRLPGDKSISHRYAMLAGLARGKTVLENFSTGADCASTLGCMQGLGCKVTKTETTVEIEGLGLELHPPQAPLDCGNSGSTIRMLAGILAGQGFSCEMQGDESLSRRPMGRVIRPLSLMGAKFSSAEGERPPLRITGANGTLHAIEYKTPVASAQVKSSILFAGLLAQGTTSVEEPVRTRDHGELALRAFGADVQQEKNRASIRGRQPLHALRATIPGDISSAAFFMCAAALFPESGLVLENVGLNPTRSALLDVLAALGARVHVLDLQEANSELRGSLKVEAGRLKGTTISGGQSAALIDELPVLAAIAPYTTEGIEIRDAGELRVKESDRIATVAQSLRAMGAKVEEYPDGLRVPGNQRLHGAKVDSHGDHRIAMAFSVAALRAEGETQILGADAARISFPEFFRMLSAITES